MKSRSTPLALLLAAFALLAGCSGAASSADDPARGGSFKPSAPGKYEYKTPPESPNGAKGG